MAAQVARDLAGKFDVIHAHDWLTYYAGMAAKAVSGKPLVVHTVSYTHLGDLENRFRQEILLGVGGIRALDKLGIQSDIFHCNEGHAAFIGIERINRLIERHKL